MARLPLVALIGRPNTGKSTLFNKLVRKRMAIESKIPGTTRDHIAHIVKTEKVDYLLLDTGGMGGGTDDKDFEDDVHQQSLLALRAADLIVFVVDGKVDPTKNDFEIATLLRQSRRRHVPVIMAINKCDNEKLFENAMHNFHQLRLEAETIPVSAAHKIGTEDLEIAIVRQLQKMHFSKESTENRAPNPDIPRVAIVGKPNVGKSSIINALMSETQRTISPKLVSPVAGTTRDSTDTLIRHQEKDFLFIDTAGLRRQAKVEEGVEGLSMLCTIQSIEECDIALLVLDSNEPVSKQDQRIASMVVDSGKGLIIMMNKIDMIDSDKKKEFHMDIARNFLFCRYAPVVPCSATTREGLLKAFELIEMVQRNRLRRIPAKELTRFFDTVVQNQPMAALHATKYVTQGKDPPPTFVIFVRNPKKVRLTQLRYLENRLRETFGLEGTPIKFITKGPRDRSLKVEEI